MTLSSPVSFAKGLADPLQHNRLKTLASLNEWMNTNGPEYEFSSVEIDQMWRALQYTMWMADKRPVQQQVAAESVLMVRKISPSLVAEWNRGFWFNMEKIYETIDKYRIPKFHLLIRIYVAEMLNQMKEREFETEFVRECIEAIVGNLHSAIGAYMQLLAVIIPELILTVGEDLKAGVKAAPSFRLLLKPALSVLERSNEVPLALVNKALSEVVSNEKVVNYSAKTREWLRGQLQKVGMDSETSQEVREAIYAALEGMEAMVETAAPAAKKRKSKTSSKSSQ